MSIKRHLFPFVGALILIADIPPGPPAPRPGPDQPPVPPSSPGCTMRKSTNLTNVPPPAVPMKPHKA